MAHASVFLFNIVIFLAVIHDKLHIIYIYIYFFFKFYISYIYMKYKYKLCITKKTAATLAKKLNE